MRRAALTLIAAVALSLSAGSASAQQDALAPQQQLRQRIYQIVQRQLAATPDQMRRITETNRKFEQQRRDLVREERDTRLALRDEITRGDQADQRHVSELLERMVRIQRQRIDIFEQEQRELATFLTPVQRAKYAAIQEQVRRRIERLRQQRRGRLGAP
jgi:Spy/CpxP family protein refolding chaperone